MEEVIVTAIVFGSLIAVLSMWLGYRKEKLAIKAGASQDSGIKTSELKSLITEAVEEVLDDRLGKLERQLSEGKKPEQLSAGKESPTAVEAEHPAPPLVARDRETTQ